MADTGAGSGTQTSQAGRHKQHKIQPRQTDTVLVCIQALVALWGQVDTELAQLTGEAVLTVAAAVSQFEEKLYKCGPLPHQL